MAALVALMNLKVTFVSSDVNALSIIIPSVVTFVVGAASGGWAGYNGWKHNQIEAATLKVTADAEKINTSEKLMSEALQLVNSLRDEVARLRIENSELRTELNKLKDKVSDMEVERTRLFARLGQLHLDNR